MSYQWQQQDGLSWVNLIDDSKFSGTTTDTLTVSNTTISDDAVFRCWLNNGYELDTYSDSVTLTVNLAPVINTQPVDTVVEQSQTALIFTEAIGKPSISYQWQFLSGVSWIPLEDSEKILGSTTDTLTISDSDTSDEGSYRCFISNGVSPDAYTNVAVLSVKIAPVITTQPVSKIVTEKFTAIFSVTASGSEPISYQWQKNGVNITGATYSDLQIQNVTVDDQAVYRVLVTNSLGSVYSDEALLTVYVQKKEGTANSPDDYVGIPGSSINGPSESIFGEDSDVTQGDSTNSNVLGKTVMQSTSVVLLDEKSGNSNGDEVDNSQSINLGKKILTSQSWIGMNVPYQP